MKCTGTNTAHGKRSCCTPSSPCDVGEGDCSSPLDNGKHYDNKDCKGNLVCGRNNCKKFGDYYDASDDCCDYPTSINPPSPQNPAPSFCKYQCSIQKIVWIKVSMAEHYQQNVAKGYMADIILIKKNWMGGCCSVSTKLFQVHGHLGLLGHFNLVILMVEKKENDSVTSLVVHPL